MLALDCEPTATPFATVTVAPVPKAVPLVAAVVVEASCKKDGMITTYPPRDHMDGFFMARMKRLS